MTSLSRSAVIGLMIGLLGLSCTGCGGGGERPKTVAVTGKVTWNGEPLKTGTVAFVPTDGKQNFPASGPIDSNGGYKLTTFKTDDGVMPGEYKVSVSVMEGADPAAKKEGTRVLPDKY